MLRLFIFVVFFVALSGTGYSWETECKKDSFTDKEKCTLKHEQFPKIVFIGYDDSGTQIALGIGDFTASSHAERDGVFLFRTGDNEAIDLKKIANENTATEEVRIIIVGEKITKVFKELKACNSFKTRISTYRDGYSDLEISCMGFTKAFNEFAKKSPLPWVQALAD